MVRSQLNSIRAETRFAITFLFEVHISRDDRLIPAATPPFSFHRESRLPKNQRCTWQASRNTMRAVNSADVVFLPSSRIDLSHQHYEDLGQLGQNSSPRDNVGATAGCHCSISGRCLLEIHRDSVAWFRMAGIKKYDAILRCLWESDVADEAIVPAPPPTGDTIPCRMTE